ncbi:MAG: hypothetical protein FE78DRAFT_35088 [Acidomyces sp. 'richmondensis']|nr:MAG: hypothetical protein FE78DRAFT_35088 [Acidomyces sp. 'richmondensis']
MVCEARAKHLRMKIFVLLDGFDNSLLPEYGFVSLIVQLVLSFGFTVSNYAPINPLPSLVVVGEPAAADQYHKSDLKGAWITVISPYQDKKRSCNKIPKLSDK